MDERIICRHCWKRAGEHRAKDYKCPPRDIPYPIWKASMPDQVKAGVLFDAQMEAYWSKSTTWFKEKI